MPLQTEFTVGHQRNNTISFEDVRMINQKQV